MFKIIRNISFTLAEMMVVMIIVGVIATLTIPTIVKTNRDRVFADMLSSEYKKIENALILDKILNFDIKDYEIKAINPNYTSEDFFEILIDKLKIMKNCGATNIGCFDNGILKGNSIRLVSGAAILVNNDYTGRIDPVDNNNEILGSTYIDVDGPIGVNKAGVDEFGFYITRKGLIPMGGPQDNIVPFSDCLKNGGFACSAWVLVNKNMDYKKCPNVINWENKKSCN